MKAVTGLAGKVGKKVVVAGIQAAAGNNTGKPPSQQAGMNPFNKKKNNTGAGKTNNTGGGIGSMIGGAVGGNVGKMIGGLVDEATGGGVKKAAPPPPVVWCVTLRRNPPVHELDQPPLGDCSKFCVQMFVVPPAFVMWLVGWFILMTLYMFAFCCFPLLGQGFFALMYQRGQQRKRVSTSEAKEVAQATACCAKSLLCLISFAAFRLIRPFNMFTTW
jgi:hypothetical protein